MTASREWSISSTRPKEPSTKPRLEVTQMKMEARTMTVPARLIKDQPRSQVPRRMLTALGA